MAFNKYIIGVLLVTVAILAYTNASTNLELGERAKKCQYMDSVYFEKVVTFPGNGRGIKNSVEKTYPENKLPRKITRVEVTNLNVWDKDSQVTKTSGDIGSATMGLKFKNRNGATMKYKIVMYAY